MGEYVPASIQFGGKLRRKHTSKLITLLDDMALHTFDENEDDPSLKNLGKAFGDDSINYGQLSDLENFGQEHGLSYIYWCDGGYDWHSTTHRYFAETNTYKLIQGSAEIGFTLSEADIEKLGSIEAIKAHFAMFRAPLPTLELI